MGESGRAVATAEWCLAVAAAPRELLTYQLRTVV